MCVCATCVLNNVLALKQFWATVCRHTRTIPTEQQDPWSWLWYCWEFLLQFLCAYVGDIIYSEQMSTGLLRCSEFDSCCVLIQSIWNQNSHPARLPELSTFQSASVTSIQSCSPAKAYFKRWFLKKTLHYSRWDRLKIISEWCHLLKGQFEIITNGAVVLFWCVWNVLTHPQTSLCFRKQDIWNQTSRFRLVLAVGFCEICWDLSDILYICVVTESMWTHTFVYL